VFNRFCPRRSHRRATQTQPGASQQAPWPARLLARARICGLHHCHADRPRLHASETGRPGGEGAAQISGYTISNVHYTLDSNNSTELASVSFAIAPASAKTVQIRLNPNGTWYTCTAAGNAARCPIPDQSLEAAVSLDIIASA